MQKNKISQVIRLLTCFLMLSSVAILRDAHFMGYEITPTTKEVEDHPIIQQKDGSLLISTTNLASDIKGYGGSTPLGITVVNGRIARIEALKNAETPDFFHQVEKELFPKWKGKTIEEATSAKVDGVSGATLSSNAVNATIRRAMQEVASLPAEKIQSTSWYDSFKSIRWIATLLVVLLGAILPLYYKNKRYRIIQLCLNVLVLGFWSCTFVSHSLIINYLSNGTNVIRSLIPLFLLVIAFLYPLFGKPKHYCMWICPLGSLQELIGKCVSTKWTISPKMMERLKFFHEGLWVLLMILMWAGICFSWMDYELFSAFLFNKASIFVVIVALLFIVLSLFVQRPYCRFFCPTGCLFHISCDVQANKRKHANQLNQNINQTH